VTFRDRTASRDAAVPPGDGRDPAATIAGIVAAIDPVLPAEAVISAVRAVATGSGRRGRLAWALQDQPALLTGAGAQAPVLSVLQLIGKLSGRGRQRHRPAAVPAVRPGHSPAPADRGALVLPQLRRQVPFPAVRAVRSRAAGRCP